MVKPALFGVVIIILLSIFISITNAATAGQWIINDGETCDEACKKIGKTCNAVQQSTITSCNAIETAFAEAGYQCKSCVDHRSYAGSPFSTGRVADDCYYLTPGQQSVCNSNQNAGHDLLCYCEIPGPWIKNHGETCDETCRALSRTCNAVKQSTITSYSAIQTAFAEAGYTCQSSGGHRSYAGSPFSTGLGSADCYYLTPGEQSVCNSNQNTGHDLLCRCEIQACSSAADCESRCCENGICVPDMADWAGIYYCPSICRAHHTCAQGTCPKNRGVNEACSCDGQCSSGCCENGICVPDMADWAGIYYCPSICRAHHTCAQGTCPKNRGVNEACSCDGQCSSGSCTSGKCV
eukprot:515609_1